MIVYSRLDGRGLMEIPAAGGTPRPLTTIDPSEAAHRFPVHLPGDRGVLFSTGVLLDLATTSIMVKPREGEPKLLVEDGTTAPYKLLATKKTSTMQKELLKAGIEGYEFVGFTVSKSRFGGSEFDRHSSTGPSSVESVENVG